ncbi:casein kinase ii subunit beta [Anaeramoeba flamelloides]|uniref:Casein kinase II subunit beta n=1 Tax=Anaeramoeba flamelloides TaxID=1746091 RepID=A0AAV7Y8Q1_9EUKA|nr:casein kinase ii subunit beta [Anaeramoeba flamelloides]
MSSTDSDSDQREFDWVERFCNKRGNEFFCLIDEEYVNSNFNLTGLRQNVRHYKPALKFIRNTEEPNLELMSEEKALEIEEDTEHLYGLIHSRYIVTDEGMRRMAKKYRAGIFGKCPNVFCKKQPCLPIGLYDEPKKDTVKLYCPKCRDIYSPKLRYRKIDGAYFGTTFPHLLLNIRETIRPSEPPQEYTPTIFGFQIDKIDLKNENNEKIEKDEDLNQNKNEEFQKEQKKENIK